MNVLTLVCIILVTCDANISHFFLSLTLVKIKDALIELKKGNITAETVKAIVNSTNEDVNLKNGLSQVHYYFYCVV